MKTSIPFSKNLIFVFFILIPGIVFLVQGCGKKAEQAGSAEPAKSSVPVKGEEDVSSGGSDQNDSSGDVEMPVFKLQNDDGGNGTKVEDDRSNIQVRKREAEEFNVKNDKTPPDSLAGQVGIPSQVITWKPKWFFEGSGGPRLPVCELSEDGSVFALVERTGKLNGPNGSRILLYNTYNWQIIGLHEFPEEKITFMALIPKTMLAAVFFERQEVLNKKSRLAVFNLKDKAELFSDSSIQDKVMDMAVWDNGILLKTSGKNPEIIYCPWKKEGGPPLKSPSENSGGVFSILDGSTAALAGEKSIEIFDPSLKISSKFHGAYENGYCPDKAEFCGEMDRIAVSAYMKKAYFFNKGKVSEISDSSGRILEFDGKNLILEQYMKNRVVFLGIPSLEEELSADPPGSKPKTKGYPLLFRELKHLGKYLVLDSSGNLYLMKKPGKSKKWKKQVIFLSTK